MLTYADVCCRDSGAVTSLVVEFAELGSLDQVGLYKSTNTDAAAGTKEQILTQAALTGLDHFNREA